MPERVAGGRENRYNQHQANRESRRQQQKQQQEQKEEEKRRRQQRPSEKLGQESEKGQSERDEQKQQPERERLEQQMNSHLGDRPEPDQVAAAVSINRLEPPSQSSGQSGPSNRGKFFKSKSSPSSLTTHKFGLRPTPSPPRLIIDHQTGDIVERYPEKPVFLRTFQPIEDATNAELSEEDDDTTQNQIDDSFASSSTQRQPQEQLNEQQQEPAPPPPSPSRAASQMGDFNEQQSASSRPNHAHQHLSRPHRQQPQQQPMSRAQVIPPPHSGKVYFAPPMTSNSLLEAQGPQPLALVPGGSFKRTLNNLSDTEPTDIAILTEPDDSYEGHEVPRMKITATSAAKANALLARQQPRPQVISTNASKLYGQPAHSRSPSIRGSAGDKWKAIAQQQQQQHHNQQQQQHQQQQLRAKRQRSLVAIEEFDLYSFCYNFRILMVLLFSALIIYLLVWPLSQECATYRPTFSYISIITASVNLIFVLAFTLFWYCTSVSRTLYQNLSSSAFIVTIYSILVCVNLTIGIMFFFINTCHFQKLLLTHSARFDVAQLEASRSPDSDHRPLLLTSDELFKQQAADPDEEMGSQYNSLRRQQMAIDEIIGSIERQLSESDRARLHYEKDDDKLANKNALSSNNNNNELDGDHSNNNNEGRSKRHSQDDQGDDTTVIDDQLDKKPPPTQHRHRLLPPIVATSTTLAPHAQPSTTTTGDFFNQDHASGYAEVPELSPIEAAWKYLKEEAALFRRSFYKFLRYYDLKFIGALHAICAACFQYLAIKVAVVRSFYCSPVGAYA